MTTTKTKLKWWGLQWWQQQRQNCDRFPGEQQSVEGGVGQAENCSCCESHWRDQVISITSWIELYCWCSVWSLHPGLNLASRLLPPSSSILTPSRCSLQSVNFSDNQYISSSTGVVYISIALFLMDVYSYRWSLTPSGTFTTTPSRAFVMHTWAGLVKLRLETSPDILVETLRWGQRQGPTCPALHRLPHHRS